MRIAIANQKGGTGKCVAAWTPVYDPETGEPRTIEDAVRTRLPSVVSLSTATGRQSVSDVGDWVDSGTQPVVTVRLASGRSVTCTPHHPLFASDGWREARHLNAGDTVASPSWLPSPNRPERLPDAEVDLLAVLLAEGGTSTRSTRFSTADPEILRIASVAAADLGLAVTPTGPSGYDYRLSGTCLMPQPPGLCQCGCGEFTGRWTYNNCSIGAVRGAHQKKLAGHGPALSTLWDMRKRHGLHLTLARNKTLPAALYRLPKDQLSRFLSVFWMCDGYVERSIPAVALASRPLIDGLQHLLLRFGVTSNVIEKPNKCAGAWQLSIHSNSFEAFAAAVPLWGYKGEQMDKILRRRRNPNLGDPAATPSLVAQLRAAIPSRCGPRVGDLPNMSDVAVVLGWGRVQFSALFESGGNVSRRVLQAFAEVYDIEDQFRYLYSDDIWWDKVVEVIDEPTPVPVYDLCVPGPENFVGGDVFLHNTTTAFGLAAAAGAEGHRVLLIDTDLSQGGSGCAHPWHTFLFEKAAAAAAPHLEGIVPLDLYGADEERAKVAASAIRRVGFECLRIDEMQDAGLTDVNRWDHIIIDCPPGQPAQIAEAFKLVDVALVPVGANWAELSGLDAVQDILDTVERPVALSAVLNRLDPRQKAPKEVQAHLDEAGVEACRTRIPRRANIEHLWPTRHPSTSLQGWVAWRDLWRELQEDDPQEPDDEADEAVGGWLDNEAGSE